MTGEMPDCSAIVSVSQVCPGNGSVPIDSSLQRFRTTSLHAKYYRCDGHVLIGSANLTESGMGLGASPNFEILALADRSFDASGV